jgi:hypothetical protein
MYVFVCLFVCLFALLSKALLLSNFFGVRNCPSQNPKKQTPFCNPFLTKDYTTVVTLVALAFLFCFIFLNAENFKKILFFKRNFFWLKENEIFIFKK